MCDWAIGTDTGGSNRIPASMCGVVGLKPTTGRVPTQGVLPLSVSLDTVGPLALDVPTARALEMMSGAPTWYPKRPDTLPRFGWRPLADGSATWTRDERCLDASGPTFPKSSFHP